MILTKLLATLTLSAALLTPPLAPANDCSFLKAQEPEYTESTVVLNTENALSKTEREDPKNEDDATENAFSKTEREDQKNEDDATEKASELGEDGETKSDDTKDEPDERSEPDSGAKNSLTEAYEIIIAHLSEILSLAAFIGSLVCAIIYKSGLLPLVESSLRSIKSATQKIKESTDKAELGSRESMGNITDKVAGLEATLLTLKDALAALAEKLDSAEAEKLHRIKTDHILEGELDMLYDIFMSSALPEYEKQRVGERVAKLKGDLSANESK